MAQQNTDPYHYSTAALAYLGDAVLEVQTRLRLVQTGIANPGRLNAMAKDYVTAKAQSTRLEKLLPILSEQERSVFLRGRNKSGAHPKSADAQEYRRATGLEALFGYLYLDGQTGRLQELFDIYFDLEP